MSRVLGRVTLLTEVRHHLEQGRSVAPAGPAGIGKSALLDAVEAEAGSLVLRAREGGLGGDLGPGAVR